MERVNYQDDVTARLYDKLSRIATPIRVGETEAGRSILLFRFGQTPKILLCGGIHAREWITSLLLVKLAEREGDGLAFDLLPCLNPDGAELCRRGIGSVPVGMRARVEAIGGSGFSGWKANLRGVDLNVNFDADWGEGKYNVTHPAPSDYIGKYPESEKETQTAVRVLRYGYALINCYHSLGEEVYWGYEHNFRHYAEARAYADAVGYKLKRSDGSAGGMKDYYALTYPGLGLTTEVGEERYGHPYPTERLEILVKRHAGSLRLLTQMGEKIDGRIRASGTGRSKESL